MWFAWLLRCDTDLLHLLRRQQIRPVAVGIPFGAVCFDGVLDAFAAVAALQIGSGAVFIAAPANAVGVFGGKGKLFHYGWPLQSIRIKIAVFFIMAVMLLWG